MPNFNACSLNYVVFFIPRCYTFHEAIDFAILNQEKEFYVDLITNILVVEKE